METLLSDVQWLVPLGRTTEASACTARKMETRLSDVQWLVPLGGTTEASARTARKDGNATF